MSYPPDSCPTCGDLAPPNDDDHISSNIREISASAAGGCESCALIQTLIVDCVPEALVIDNGNGAEVVIRQAIMRSFVEVVVKWPQDNVVILDPFISAGTYCPWPSVRVGVPTPGSSISLASFNLVENWLQDCRRHHLACNLRASLRLPTRVLDLHSAQPNLVLCEPNDKEAKYICLSHCWGASRAITTKLSNIEQFKDCISFSALPRTFQEAVIFSRKLGVQYLWIDSLCIIQDSEQDWQAQSALMSQIYANSYLTLAATGSSCDESGLFFRHPKSYVRGISRIGVEYEVHARPVINHMDDAHFPLFKRAWVFQERLLAPRVLHFGRQELWWECLERVACECGGIFGERYGTGQEKFLSKLTHQEALSKSELRQVSRRWHAIVEEYSQLSLTMMRDKLPALSGIAEQIGALREGDYLAGAWSDTLVMDLLWYRHDALSGHFTDEWRAPTWSWAGLEGAVRYFDAPHITESPNITTAQQNVIQSLRYTYVFILNSATRISSKNPFGEVTSAHLHLRGPLIAVQIFDNRTRSSRTLQRRRSRRLRGAYYEFRFESLDSTNSYSFFADYDLQKQDAKFAESEFACLRVGTDESGDEYTILVKCIATEQGIYERVGLFTTKFSRWASIDHMETFGAAFSGEDIVRELTLV